jgi:glutamine amidotransferase
MPITSIPAPTVFQPIGQTDSEKLFCWLLSSLRDQASESSSGEQIAEMLMVMCGQINQAGVSNILLSDGEYLYVFCSTKLNWITRRSPFGEAHLCDDDVKVDFSSVTTENDIVTVIATEPLTNNETWQQMKSGEFRVFKDGDSVWCGYTNPVEHKKSNN